MSAELKNLERRLKALGLTRSGRRRGTSGVIAEQRPGEVLKTFAESSGALFVAFAHHLATRLDLLPLSDCVALAAAKDRSPETDFGVVRRLVRQQLGSTVEELFGDFEKRPVRRTPLAQWHRAVTLEERRVTVKIGRPELMDGLDDSIGLLRVLEAVDVNQRDWAAVDFSDLVAAFLRDLQLSLDMEREKQALLDLAGDVQEPDALVVAAPVEGLCSPQILVVEELEGRSLESWTDEPETADRPESGEAARRICLAWMQQALLGGCYPADPRPQHLVVLDDKRVGVVGGGAARLSVEARRSMIEYLAAASRQDPDLAAALLAREMVAGDEADLNCLRMSIRQAEPFRDGGWVPAYAGQRLAHTLFVHWRLATRCGFRPSDGLLAFFNALAHLEATALAMSPSRDPLDQAVDDVRVIAAAVNLRGLFGPTRMVANLERLLPAGQELLYRLDEIALLVDQGRLHLSDERRARRRAPPHRAEGVRAQALLLVIVTAVLVIPRCIAGVVLNPWVEAIATVVFFAAAGTLLWRVGRWRTP